MKLINKITIDESSMASIKTIRAFTVEGDPGAVFTMTVVNEDGHFYNFSEDTSVALAFSSSAAKLKPKTINETGVYTGSIEFPAITDDDHYIVALYVDNASDTFLSENFSNNKIFISPKIHKYHDTTVTFSLVSTGSDSTYNSYPSNVTFTGPSYLVKKSFRQTKTINWPVTLSSSQFIIARQPLASDSIVREVIPGYKNYNKSYEDTNIYEVPKAITTDSQGKEVITDSTGGTIVISNASTWSSGVTLTFTGKGSSDSNNFNNTVFGVKNLLLTIDPVVTTTDAAVSNSTTIPITSTDGIKAAETVLMTGIGVTNASPHVDAISAGVNITASSAQTLENGQTVTFTGSSRSATITADVTMSQHGTDDMTLTLALDNILTVG